MATSSKLRQSQFCEPIDIPGASGCESISDAGFGQAHGMSLCPTNSTWPQRILAPFMATEGLGIAGDKLASLNSEREEVEEIAA